MLSARALKRLSAADGQSFILDAGFDVPAGITILFGPSGSGKTSLLDCIAGLLRPDEGRIAVGERVLFDSARGTDVPASRRDVGYVFQDLALFPHLTVEQNLHYGLGRIPSAERQERTAAILESFRISHLMKRRPREASGGEGQRVALARSLVTEPGLLLLDEPLAGLDARVKSRIIDDLRAWNRARRIPIVYVTHSRREAFALGERVVFLEEGRVLAQGTPQEVLEAPRHETVAQLAGFENIFDATVAARHEAQGTMTCLLAGSAVEIEVPLARREPGERIRIAVRAGDILLATSPPQGLSARNVVPGRLLSLSRQDVTVTALVDCGVRVQVLLTPAACESLALETGREVWLVIKTYSCHLVDSHPAQARPPVRAAGSGRGAA